MSLSTGQIINNRYRIVKQLGRGGMAEVYKAWDMNLNAPCVVKENKKLLPAEQEQFAKEARLLFKLKHPNLPSVHDLFTLPGLGQFLVMDFIEGEDLAEVVDARGVLPETEAVAYITQVCDALTYLHSQNPKVIHRDIKPANIKVTPHGQVFLVDFGIAKTGEAGQPTTDAARGITPGYSPPEQYGYTKTDARTDIYALGATLYTLLTGTVPPESVLRMQRNPLTPPRQLNPAISLSTEAAILQAMQNDPELRFQSAAGFKAAISDQYSTAGSQPSVVTQPPSPLPAARGGAGGGVAPAAMEIQPDRPFPWKLVWMGAGLLAGLALLIVVVGLLAQKISSSHLTQTAQARSTQTARALAALPPQTSTSLPPTDTPDVTPTFTSSPSPPAVSPTLTEDFISPVDGMPLVSIPAGTFLMGEDAERGLSECRLLYDPFASDNCGLSWFASEEPVHRVTLDSFYIDTHEVTNAQYAQCVSDGLCTPPQGHNSFTRNSYYGDPVYADYPVILVSWDQARIYCSWAGRRLPTEAEWEYAARGGVEGLSYPWGSSFNGELANFCDVNCPEDYANTYFDDGFIDTAPVGRYPPNGYGLYDMAGNVAEWVRDWFSESYYSVSPAENPVGPLDGAERVFRNGSWDGFGYSLRSANRNWDDPDVFRNFLGFRCALSP